MAWIPLLLAGWFVVDIVIVVVLLVVARRRRRRALRAGAPAAELRPIPPPAGRGASRGVPGRAMVPTR